MANSSLKVLDALKGEEKCVFCRQNFVDDLQYGKLYQYEDVIAHYFCMLFSSHIEQNGSDDKGICGFLPKDVKKEITRGKKIECIYCHHFGATVACCFKPCKKRFHFPCGVENGSMHQFFGAFKSFCVSHRKVQNVPQAACKLTENYLCLICQEEVKPKPSLSTIWAPCCKMAWFHRNCVQRMANSAGYFFKCPNCNNKDEFRKEMTECGIYIPDHDASWEAEPNAFHELGERYNSCDAETCLCPDGRSYGLNDGFWEIVLCMLCGSSGVHSKCGKRQLDDLGQWTCPLCSRVSHKSLYTIENSEVEPDSSDLVLHAPETLAQPSSSTRRVRRTSRRRRASITLHDDCNSLRKKNRSESLDSEDNESDTNSCVFNENGKQTEVVNCDTPSSKVLGMGGVNVNWNNLNPVYLDDSDDNESDLECGPNFINKSYERPPIPISEKSCPRSLVCDTVIDLLESDDEILPVADPITVTSTSTEDDSDDVVFVSCDIPNKNESDDIPSSTALLRFVDENKRVYIVSPADVKKRGGLENLTSAINSNISTGSSHVPRSNSSSTVVWQSVPLSKSFVHSSSSNLEITSNGNCTPLDNFIRKNRAETETSDNTRKSFWKSSEVIHID